MSAAYVRQHYNVPAKRGMRVTVDGNLGTIASFRSAYIMVRFDGHRRSKPCHPTWRVEYHGEA